MEMRKQKDGKRKKILVWGFLVVVICALFVFGKVPETDAASLFDGAVTWEPIKMLHQSEGTHYYQIMLTEANTVYFHDDVPDIYNTLGEHVSSSGSVTLEAGTWYAKFQGQRSCWYGLAVANDKTNIENNIAGSPFEKWTPLQPLDLLTVDEFTESNRIYKIVLTEPGKITFKEGGVWQSNWGSNLYDNDGRELGVSQSVFKDRSFNLAAGTYWLRFPSGGSWLRIGNFYYILSNPDKATGITMSQPTATLHVDETIRLGYTLAPAKCEDSVSWSSGNTSVAKVDEKGKVTAVGVGECLIIATTGSKKSASCKLTVIQASPATCKHNYSASSYVYPTYLKKGYTKYTCSKCRKTYKDNYTNKLTLNQGSISYLTAGKRSIKVTYYSISNADGIQIRYSRDKKFKKNTKIVTAKNTYAGSRTLKKLSRKKKYYVQVRGYKKVGTKTVYGKWSVKKSVKVK